MEDDRMSQLPDDILLLILDKIDTLEAVKTSSLLSHRWKNLRYLLPSLRLHLSFARLRLKFRPFAPVRSELVSQLLSDRDATATIHDFHLSFHDGRKYVDKVDMVFLEECVLYAINHGIQSLRLHAYSSRTLTLPEAFISCKTLRELDLRQCYAVVAPGRLSLPNLKTFHLDQTFLFFYDDDDDNNMIEPFSGLPELENLTLIGCCFDYDALVIKAPKLKVLDLDAISCEVKLEIYTPLLTSFSYKSDRAWECANVNLPMLEQVHLDIHCPIYLDNDVNNSFVRMLHQFQNATIVSLTLDTLKVLECNGGPLEQTPSPFPNMKCLKVMEGRHGICTMFRGVLTHLTGTTNCEKEFSPGVEVVEQISNEDKNNDSEYSGFYDSEYNGFYSD